MIVNIKFNVTGTCHQTIRLDEYCKLTVKEVLEGLEKGTILAAMEEGAGVITVSEDNELMVIGSVIGNYVSGDCQDYKNDNDADDAEMSFEFRDEDDSEDEVDTN